MAAQGPDSFVPDARVNYSQAQAAAPLQIRNDRPAAANQSAAQFRPGTVNYIGNQAVNLDKGVEQQQENGNATQNWLMKAAGEQIAPYVAAYTEKLAMDGIQQVASGKAIQEIIDDQPWYSRIFGNSDLISAARGYTAQEQVSKFHAEVSAQLAGMVTASPEEAKQFIYQSMKNFQTGDTLTDAVTNQQMIATSADLFSQWTKANYKAGQYQARKKQLDAYGAMGQEFESQARAHYVDQTVSSDSLNVSAQKFLQGLMPVDGQAPDAWADNVKDTVVTLAQGGNFHAVNLLMSSGILSNLTQEQRQQLNSVVRTEESRVQSEKMATEFAEPIQNLLFNMKTMKLGWGEVQMQVAAINDEAARKYGFTNPMITPKQAQGWISDVTDLSAGIVNRDAAVRQQEALDAARKAGDARSKQEIDDQRTREATNMFSSGGTIGAGMDTERLQTIAPTMYQSMNQTNPGSGMKALVGLYVNNGSSGVMKTLQSQFNAPLKMAGQTAWTPEFDAAVLPTFNAMTALPGGKEAAAQYYGENYERILSYQAMLSSHTPAPLAYNAAFVQPTLLGDVSKLSQTDRDKLTSQISDSYKQQFPDSDFNNLNDAAVATVLNRSQANLARIQNRAGLDTNAKYEEAVRMAMNDGTLALYGQYAWPRNREDTPVHELIHVTPQQTYLLMRQQMEQDVSLKGTDLDQAQFVEQFDGKTTSLMVYAKDGHGVYRTSIITTDQLAALRDKGIRERQEWTELYRRSSARAAQVIY